MLTSDQRHWCREQAIEIVKLAPADAVPTHDRLKRVYKRLMSLVEDAAMSTPSSTKDAIKEFRVASKKV